MNTRNLGKSLKICAPLGASIWFSCYIPIFSSVVALLWLMHTFEFGFISSISGNLVHSACQFFTSFVVTNGLATNLKRLKIPLETHGHCTGHWLCNGHLGFFPFARALKSGARWGWGRSDALSAKIFAQTQAAAGPVFALPPRWWTVAH